MQNIAVLVSGNGSNLQALLDARAQGKIPGGRIALVISSRPGAYALSRAEQAGVPTQVVNPDDYESRLEFDEALCEMLQDFQIDLVVLAGFMYILGPAMLQAYPNRILNVHPSLIPAFCGDGFYGLRVHQAVLEAGVPETGATVHLVNEVTDGGPILLQKKVAVHPGDTPETLQRRVLEEAEWVLLPQATQQLCEQLEHRQ